VKKVKIISLLLAMLMVFSLLPMDAEAVNNVLTIIDTENTYGTAVGTFDSLPLYKVSVSNEYDGIELRSSGYGSTPINKIFAGNDAALGITITVASPVFQSAVNSFNNYLSELSVYIQTTTLTICFFDACIARENDNKNMLPDCRMGKNT
jgi:hypothetical protein